MTDEQARNAVNLIFEDLRDRRFLKWMFCGDPEQSAPILHDHNGEPLWPLDSAVQRDIREEWARLIKSAAGK